MCESPQAVLTKYHRLSDLNKKCSPILKPGSPRPRPQEAGVWGGLLSQPAHRCLLAFLCAYVEEKELWCLLPSSGPRSQWISCGRIGPLALLGLSFLPKGLSPNTVSRELGLQHMKFEGIQFGLYHRATPSLALHNSRRPPVGIACRMHSHTQWPCPQSLGVPPNFRNL